jgi:AcrR family transcriptional regulator
VVIMVSELVPLEENSKRGVAAALPISRNPERTQERILKAAFQEFAGNGFAGARVDSIARRAGINKRMLYHYFGDKEALFREVLRRKMAERKAWGAMTPDDPHDSLPYWFDLACRDLDWIRMLEWEALQFIDDRLIDENRRRKAVGGAVDRIRVRQKLGHISNEFSAKHILLAMIALTWFPLAFPQLTRLITGQSASKGRFRSGHKAFLRKFATAFEGKGPASISNFASRRNGDNKLKLP